MYDVLTMTIQRVWGVLVHPPERAFLAIHGRKIPKTEVIMQSIEQLENLGIDKINAQRMIDSYKLRLGYERGILRVTDITYLSNNTRDIELTCSKCGRQYHKEFINGKNKWCELRSICECEREEERAEKKREKEHQRELKKFFNEEKRRQDRLSRLGRRIGDHTITFVDDKAYILTCNKCGNVVQRKGFSGYITIKYH